MHDEHVSSYDELETIGPDQPAPRNPRGALRPWPLLAGVALLLVGGGFLLGRAARDGEQPLPPCGDRALGLIKVSGLPDAAVRVEAPLRPAGMGDAPLPLPGSMTVEIVGTSEEEDTFRPSGGRLELAVELPLASIGSSADITTREGSPLGSTRITSPLCVVASD